MPFVSWDDKLSVGHPVIDGDHKKLVSYVNELHDAMAQGKARDHLGDILNKLLAYTKEHFVREELLWASRKYAGLQEHKKQHQELLKKVLDFSQEFRSGKALITVQVMTFLRDWLINHIAKSDVTAAKATQIGAVAGQASMSQSV